jgi:UDP-N-acetylglucosamine transferase subunit ALG13
VIFVTVGSHPTYPFTRLLEALPRLAGYDLMVQYGPAPAPDGITNARPWLGFAEVLACMRTADAVITHAGAGTMMCARNLGHTPIIVPRLVRYGETVDDHQVELAQVFEQAGLALVAWNLSELPRLLREIPVREETSVPQGSSLCRAVRAALTEDKA